MLPAVLFDGLIHSGPPAISWSKPSPMTRTTPPDDQRYRHIFERSRSFRDSILEESSLNCCNAHILRCTHDYNTLVHPASERYGCSFTASPRICFSIRPVSVRISKPIPVHQFTGNLLRSFYIEPVDTLSHRARLRAPSVRILNRHVAL